MPQTNYKIGLLCEVKFLWCVLQFCSVLGEFGLENLRSENREVQTRSGLSSRLKKSFPNCVTVTK